MESNAPASTLDLLARALGSEQAEELRCQVAQRIPNNGAWWKYTYPKFVLYLDSAIPPRVCIQFYYQEKPHSLNLRHGMPMTWEEAVVAAVWFPDHLADIARQGAIRDNEPNQRCTILSPSARG